MAGSCGCGARTAPRVSSDPCNAVQSTAGGLLVPTPEVEGIAPGTAVGTARSVDIDVTAPAAGACPAVWEVGARLTPISGEAASTAAVNLNALATATWANVPGMSFTAPEAGTYRFSADVSGYVSSGVTAAFNRLVSAVLTLNGVILANTVRHVFQLNVSGSVAQGWGINGSITSNKILQLAAGDVIRVQVAHFGSPGTPAALEAGSLGGSLLSWDKVSD